MKRIISPTVWYLLIALTCGLTVWVWFWHLLPQLLAGNVMSGAVLAMLHLAILGTLLTGALGVMFQLIPIAFRAPTLPKRITLWHLPVHLIAVLIMVFGFLASNFLQVAIGGSLLFANTLLYLAQVYKSYRKAYNKTIIHQRLWLPLLGLIMVMSIGIWQALDLPGTGLSLLFSHIFLGVLWFWGGLVLIISYKFIPMFILSHGYYANLKLAVNLYFGGIALLLVNFYWPYPGEPLPGLLGTVFVVGGMTQAGLDIHRMMQARKRKRIVFPLQITIFGTAVLGVAILFLLAALLWQKLSLAVSAAFLFYFTGMFPILAGYTQKIIPFLYYEHRYSHSPDRKSAPLIDEMVPKSLARPAIYLYYISVFSGAVMIAINSAIPATATFLLTNTITLGGSVAIVLLAIALLRVLRIGGKRPDL